MQIEILKSKIHRVKVTGADLNYIGSITIDSALIEAANLVPGEKVQIVNINNGERLETYVIEGEKNSGEITLNGPAARKVQRGDMIIIISYCLVPFEKARDYKPVLLFPNEETNLLQ
ncbi:aspartate 1-decarboxylase [Flavobacteriaceae bacterium]|jgi:aspartate 1-decarboxylase|nr:aspartate 1-decarboxylase [bacterium]MDB4773137.1 aspartate 1-decarboxylase [Flavobacteriaceae bacterium]